MPEREQHSLPPLADILAKLRILPLEVKEVLALAEAVPQGLIIAPTVCTVLNRHYDAGQPPTTTTDSAGITSLMFNKLAEENPTKRPSFELAQDYFTMAGLLLQERISSEEIYSRLYDFFKRAKIFDSSDLTETEYITKCLLQAGIEISPRLIADYTRSLPEGFHLQYLKGVFPPGVEIMDQNPANYTRGTDQ